MNDIVAWTRSPCRAPDRAASHTARQRQDRLTKPNGSLGRLEELAVRLAALQGDPMPGVDPLRCLLFAADHGVAAEGVSAFPQTVTRQMVANIAAGGAAVAVLARTLGAELEIVDCGVAWDSPAEREPLANVRDARLGPGTGNLVREEAMTAAQAAAALSVGREAVERAREAGVRLLIAGEMGIANTTSAAALAAALLGRPAADLVGPGTGLDRPGVQHKIRIVSRALALHCPPDAAPPAPFLLLQRLGGFEIAAMAGVYLAAGQAGIPALVDGFIATAAALAACRLNPGVRPWLLFSHRSAEPGHARALLALDADPLLDLGMRLGEGSGALVAVPLLRLACALHAGMATFEEAGVSHG